MVAALIDTTIVVDILRSYPIALDWFSEQPLLGVSPMVWVEVLEGVEDLRAQKRAVEILRHFERVDPEPQDYDWAFQQALRLKLSPLARKPY